MPTRSQLLPVLGPLLDLGPRVLVLLFAGVVALAAATTCARAIRLCRPLWFLGGWLVGGVAVVAARVGAESLAAYGRSGWQSGDGVPGALSIAGVAAFVQPRLLVIALSVAFGAAMSVALALLRRGPAARNAVSGVEVGGGRAARVGRVGEQIVAAELVLLGWPALHNVILVDERGMTAEIDHLVRVPDGIVVLETKTYSGFVTGSERDSHWTQHLPGGLRVAPAQPGDAKFGACSRCRAFCCRPVRACARLRGECGTRSLLAGDRACRGSCWCAARRAGSTCRRRNRAAGPHRAVMVAARCRGVVQRGAAHSSLGTCECREAWAVCRFRIEPARVECLVLPASCERITGSVKALDAMERVEDGIWLSCER